jgi:hypothetical protein
MIRGFLIALIFAAAAVGAQALMGTAHAQLRTIPAEAKRGTLSHVQGMVVELNGRQVELAAGAQIRDGRNMIVLPTALPPGILVKYLPSQDGKLSRVWILSPQEAAQPDPQK